MFEESTVLNAIRMEPRSSPICWTWSRLKEVNRKEWVKSNRNTIFKQSCQIRRWTHTIEEIFKASFRACIRVHVYMY